MPDIPDIEFGDDDGADDAWDASGAPIDPFAVAVRFHDSRVLDEHDDDAGLGFWHTLSDEDREIALFIARGLVERIEEDPDPRSVANWLRDLREYLGDDVSRRDVRRDRRLISDLIDSLRREGTLR